MCIGRDRNDVGARGEESAADDIHRGILYLHGVARIEQDARRQIERALEARDRNDLRGLADDAAGAAQIGGETCLEAAGLLRLRGMASERDVEKFLGHAPAKLGARIEHRIRCAQHERRTVRAAVDADFKNRAHMKGRAQRRTQA